MATDSVNVETKVGPVSAGDGTTSQYLRAAKTSELVVSMAHAQHYEAAGRKKVYMASNQTVITFGTALTATGVTFHLCNPINSPVDLVVLQTRVTVLTAGTGGHVVYAHSASPATEVTAGTALTVYNGRLGSGGGYGLAKSATTLPSTPVAVQPLISAITAAGVFSIIDYVDGALVVPPGSQLSLQGITIVGTGLCGMVWEEVPV